MPIRNSYFNLRNLAWICRYDTLASQIYPMDKPDPSHRGGTGNAGWEYRNKGRTHRHKHSTVWMLLFDRYRPSSYRQWSLLIPRVGTICKLHERSLVETRSLDVLSHYFNTLPNPSLETVTHVDLSHVMIFCSTELGKCVACAGAWRLDLGR